MRAAYYASLAIVPWVVVTLLLRLLIHHEGWPVGLVGTMSRLVSVPLLGVWILATGAGWRRLLPRGTGRWLLLMGLVSILINLCWFGAVKWTSATNVSMLIRFDLVFVVLIGVAFGLERMGAAQAALLPIMLLGLGLLTEAHKFDWHGHLLGDVIVVIAAFGFAANAFVIRHIMQVMDEASVAFYNHGISTFGFLGLALAGRDFARWQGLVGEPAPGATVFLLGVALAAGLPLYYVALRRMEVWKLRTFMLLTPVITAAVEWPLWGVELTGLQCLGGAIILGGLAALIHLESRAPTPREAAARAGQWNR
jgi:drug/metabolite transporter (DMT)-like permease